MGSSLRQKSDHRTVDWVSDSQNDVHTGWAVLQHGDSGGPVFLDYSHRLVGVNLGFVGDTEAPGSYDVFTHIPDWVAQQMYDYAQGWEEPANVVRIHWGREYPWDEPPC